MDNDGVQINIIEFFYFIWKKVFWLISGLLAGIIIAALMTVLFITPKYSSTIEIYVTVNRPDDNYSSGDYTLSKNFVNTYIEIIKTDSMLQKISDQLSYNMTPGQISKALSMSAANGTELLVITAETTNPLASADICNTVYAVAKVEIARILDVSKIEAIGEAQPSYTASSPNLIKNILLGGFCGVAIIAVILFLVFVTDTSVKSEEELKKRFDFPVLGEVPQFYNIEALITEFKKGEKANEVSNNE